MLKLLWAEIRQLKKPVLFLLLTIPLLHYLDTSLYRHALPTTVEVQVEGNVFLMNEPFADLSAWPFVIMASVILLLFSHEAGGGLQGRLSSLACLPVNRLKIGILRHLPALIVILALGVVLNVYRFMTYFVYAISKSDPWRESHGLSVKIIKDAGVWAFNVITNFYENGLSSVLFQFSGWAAISFLILGIPLLIDDVWPNIKRSSFALWLSVSLFTGVGLQVGVLAIGKHFGLSLFPNWTWPSVVMPTNNPFSPSIMSIEIILALSVLTLELWRFQNRSSYV